MIVAVVFACLFLFDFVCIVDVLKFCFVLYFVGFSFLFFFGSCRFLVPFVIVVVVL